MIAVSVGGAPAGVCAAPTLAIASIAQTATLLKRDTLDDRIISYLTNPFLVDLSQGSNLGQFTTVHLHNRHAIRTRAKRDFVIIVVGAVSAPASCLRLDG